MQTVRTLFRPVGLREMQLIAEAGYKAFPPRLPEQPIFYPVTNLQYAESIAREWNAPDPRCGHVGFVTAFELPLNYLHEFEERIVGSAICSELWVPAEKLPEFNAQICGQIRVIRAFYGDSYAGPRELFALSA
ncbi:MAG TPA: ADP-ribosylation/crystallin J1 [Planctomycetota bacterium]|nr:ADP-ribosylation/crystallin J1 [Planctomycetota bacterium]